MRTIGGIRIPDKDTYKIMSTFKYEDFKFIEGNRDVDHEEKIEKSIRKSGLLIQPVLVNERMEIIEGQNRFYACKNLGLPIYYVMQNDIGLEEVKSLNSASKNWTTRNYVHSYAAGDKKLDYIYVEQLQKAYPWATHRIIGFATHGEAGCPTYTSMKSGNFKCSDAEYNKAVEVLDYASQFREGIDGIGGRKEFYVIAIMFCYFCEEVDSEYLLTKFKKYYKSLTSINDIEDALTQIESKIYNYQLRTPREPIALVGEYNRAKRVAKRNKKRED